MGSIESNLLSKNNWVMLASETSDMIMRVSEILEDGIVTTKGESALCEYVYGIELTADWLKAAGFQRFDYGLFGRRDFARGIIPHEYCSVQFQDAQIAGIRFVQELHQLYGVPSSASYSFQYPEQIFQPCI